MRGMKMGVRDSLAAVHLLAEGESKVLTEGEKSVDLGRLRMSSRDGKSVKRL